MSTVKYVGFFFGMLLSFNSVVTAQTSNQLDVDVQVLRSEESALERDIDLLERELLFPSLTRVEVYLSLDDNLLYTLRSLTIAIDDAERHFYTYTQKDLAALRLGGLQSFWKGNVALGYHRILARFKGLNAKGRSVEHQAELTFVKKAAGKVLELMIAMGNNKRQAVFAIKDRGEK